MRIFFDGHAKQIKVLCPAFCVIRLVNGHKKIGFCPNFRYSAIRHRIFVCWMRPMVSFSCVYFLIFKGYPTSPIKHVTKSCSFSDFPNALYFRTPARLQNLIKIEAYTNINISGKQRHRGISRRIKPPRRNKYFPNIGSTFFRQFNRLVGTPGISNQNNVSPSR